jgi:hypothetical protein
MVHGNFSVFSQEMILLLTRGIRSASPAQAISMGNTKTFE